MNGNHYQIYVKLIKFVNNESKKLLKQKRKEIFKIFVVFEHIPLSFYCFFILYFVMVWADIKMLSPETLRNHWNLFLTLLEVREVQSQDSASLCYSRDSCTSVLMAVLVIIAKNGIGLDGFQLWMDDENVICVKIKSHSNKKENVICVYVYTHTYIPISALKKNEILGRWWAFWNIIVSGRNFRKMEDILKYYSEWVSQAQKDTCLYILLYANSSFKLFNFCV